MQKLANLLITLTQIIMDDKDNNNELEQCICDICKHYRNSQLICILVTFTITTLIFKLF